jgi:hypothetical protein
MDNRQQELQVANDYASASPKQEKALPILTDKTVQFHKEKANEPGILR